MRSALRVAGLVVALLATTTVARAQSQSDLVYVGGRITARAPLDDRPGKREDGSFQAAVRTPSFALAPGSLLTLGAGYRYTVVNLNGDAAFANEPSLRDLHALDLSVAYTQILGRRWSASIGVVPGLRTDFDQKFSSRDFQVAGFALATYLVGGDPRLRVSFGLAAQTRWSFSPVIPLVSVAYRNEFVSVDAGVNGLNGVFRLGDRVEIGLFASFSADWYHVNSGSAARLAAARYLRLFEVAAGPQLNVRAAGPVWLNARAGYTIVRQGIFGDADRNEIGGVSLDTAGTLFGQLGVSIRDEKR